MLFKVLRNATTAWLAFASVAVCAGEAKDALIDKAIATYGGDALVTLQTLRIDDHYKTFRRGQSRNAGEVDQASYRTSTTIDFANGRKSFQSIGGIYVPGLHVQHAFFDGMAGYRIDHTGETVAESANVVFANVDRGLSWRTDLVLVKLLSQSRKTAALKGKAFHMGRPQQVISFTAEGHPEFTLHIDRMTGLVSRMVRSDRAGNRYSYTFSEHRHQEGFTFAADTYVMKNGEPESLTASRMLTFNTDIDSAYSFPPTYSAPAAMVDFPEMSVQKLADGVYFTGQHAAFSVFVDAGDYLLASGGYPGLKDRFDAVKAFTGTDKPLGYQIVTHHHDDHVGGLRDAAELGATFITVKEHMDAVRAATGIDLGDDRIALVDGNGAFAGGLVQVGDIASWHAGHNLVTYIPHAKAVFSADHFFTFLESGAPEPAEMYAAFRSSLEGFGWDMQSFATAHSGRVMTYGDLVKASTGPFRKLACPDDWQFCVR